MKGVDWGFFQAVLGNIHGLMRATCSLTWLLQVLGGFEAGFYLTPWVSACMAGLLT